MPIECEAEESGEHGGLWKARVKAFPLATGYGYSETEACRAACDAIISAANADLTRLRAENGALAGKLAQAEADKARLAVCLQEMVNLYGRQGGIIIKKAQALLLEAPGTTALEAVRSLTTELSDGVLDMMRESIGNTNVAVLREKRDALRAAFHLEKL